MMQVGQHRGLTARALLAYAPRRAEPGGPWLFEYDVASGAVTALVPRDECGPVTCRREDCVRRAHATLASACAAYGLDAAHSLELRWWTGCGIERVAALEARRLGAHARVVRDGDVLRVVACA